MTPETPLDAFLHADEVVQPMDLAGAVWGADRGATVFADLARADRRWPAPTEADARAASRATATRARLLGLVGPGRSGGSIT